MDKSARYPKSRHASVIRATEATPYKVMSFDFLQILDGRSNLYSDASPYTIRCSK